MAQSKQIVYYSSSGIIIITPSCKTMIDETTYQHKSLKGLEGGLDLGHDGRSGTVVFYPT
jgi:hypothetical protein